MDVKIDLIHCDGRILHAPKECLYCDKYPERQALREMWGINFTGHYDTDKIICPSEQRRPLEIINQWHGNVPITAEQQKKDTDWDKIKQAIEKCFTADENRIRK